MCKYCDLSNFETYYINKYKDIESGENLKISMAYDESNEYMLYAQSSKEWLLHKINYCPMCGRKLVEE